MIIPETLWEIWNKRRGRVLGMNPQSGGYQVIEADVPMTGMFGYCTTLRSMTGGRGSYSYEFARYEQAPADVQEKKLKSVQLKNKNKEKPGENPGFFYCTFVLKVVYIL